MSMTRWLKNHRTRVFSQQRYIELCQDMITDAFERGWNARGHYDQTELTGRGIILPGYDAVKEAERIMEGK